ncbi:MAG: putative metal-binding motif-containing protein, partial [Nitrospirae bacterium]|nr:putative metal-binding motif-containing protein [Nitrospirota bacterium]
MLKFRLFLVVSIFLFVLSLAAAPAYAACTDVDGDGYGNPGDASCTRGATKDCNDNDNTVYPGAPKTCDGKDNNCDGRKDFTTDEDKDHDGVLWCAGDCDDNNAARFPGNPEICDGIDNDCVSGVPSNEIDTDGDTYRLCSVPPDCNNNDASINPGSPEICGDNKDNNCNGQVDEAGCVCPDADADGQTSSVCGGTDCNDNDNTVYLGAPELCTDGKDNNCNGIVDIQDPVATGCPAYCADTDGDNYFVGG